MRAKYYKLGMRQMRKEKSFVFFLVLLVVFSSVTTFYTQKIEPILYNFTKSNAYGLAMNATEKAIFSKIHNISYDSIISKQYDKNGKLVALYANTGEINKISNELILEIENNILKIDESNINIPLALFLDLGVFGGEGAKINIKTIPLGDTKIECVSQFESVGINQTRHRILLDVKTYYTIISPVYIRNECYHTEVLLAETIINGDIPSSYTNLDLTKLYDNISLS